MRKPEKYRIFSLTIAGFLLAIFSYGQTECHHKPKRKAVKTYEEAMELMESKVLLSVKSKLLEALQLDSNYLEARYQLGELYLRMGNIQAAYDEFIKLLNICDSYDIQLYFKLGELASVMGKHERAVQHLEDYLAKRRSPKALELFQREKQLLDWYANPVPYDPKPVKGISTKDDEYLACITADERQIYFTRRYQKQSRAQITPVTVEEFTLSELLEDEFSIGEALDKPFNQNNNEGGPSLTATNNEMYMTICEANGEGGMNCDIFYAHKKYGYWTNLQRLPAPINRPDSWESQPSISADGEMLYFVSSRAGGEGGLDIYRVRRMGSQKWGAVENLGSKLNTPQDDKAPFIHTDSQTLYFASKGHSGLGGYDMFRYNLKDSSLMNLGYPINTEDDELGIFVSLSGKKAFFASNQLQGKGGWDLYSFDLYEEAQPEKVFMVRGKVENPSFIPEVTITNLRTKESVGIKVDSASGDYLAIVNKEDDDDYLLTMQKDGFAFTSEYIESKNVGDKGLVETELELNPIKLGAAYPLRNINFDTDSYELKPQGIAEIFAFGKYLLANPKIHVKIEGHTDNIGGSEKNQQLSEQRARVVTEQLLDMGISKERLKFVGYGATKPIADNNTEEGRAKNRRTVFMVTKK